MNIRFKILYLFLSIAFIIPLTSITISEYVPDSKLGNSENTLNILTTSSIATQETEYKNINSETSENKKSSAEKDSNLKIAYITIDDGPSRNNTTQNLDTLKNIMLRLPSLSYQEIIWMMFIRELSMRAMY